MTRNWYRASLVLVLAGCGGGGGGERAAVEAALVEDPAADVPATTQDPVVPVSLARTAVLRVDGMT